MSAFTLPGGLPWPARAMARAMPFIAFVVLMALETWFGRMLAETLDSRWLYAARSVAVAGLLLVFWRRFGELSLAAMPRTREVLLALASGMAVLAIWLCLDTGFFVLGHPGSGFDPRSADGGLDWLLAISRLAGSALLVPVMEELFWRSLVMRWVERSNFLELDPAEVGVRALLLSSVAFGFEHGQWAAGVLAGLVYGGLYIRCRNLWIPVVAHAATNAGLGIWVLANGAWHFW